MVEAKLSLKQSMDTSYFPDDSAEDIAGNNIISSFYNNNNSGAPAVDMKGRRVFNLIGQLGTWEKCRFRLLNYRRF